MPELLPADEFYALTANAWTETNELDLHSYPTEMSLAHDGTFTASFRHGECEVGTFSVVATNLGVELNPNVRPNTCDTRGGGSPANIGASNEHLVIDDGLRRFYGASYRDASASGSVESLSFTAYGNDALRVDARWSAPLSPSSRAWELALHNGSTRMQTVTSIVISVTPLVATSDGYSTAGAPIVLVDRVLHEQLGPGREYARDEDVAIGETGLLLLTIVVSSYDAIQRYDNQRSFILSL